ncbi:uncharacterized protein LOC127263505 [Andrographis paniculata]|uniref:uncharacterized protein LOC127263505 n=1 Tax=Andrographis paniculata TaxID=175694 RepID=UPI0021E94869|nr:uncharacterized protein LOC127263505 [Andrographis paniculata]
MAATNSCKLFGFDYCQWPTSGARAKFDVPVSSLGYSQPSDPKFGCRWKSLTLSRVSTSCRTNKALRQCSIVPRIASLLEDGYEDCRQTEPSSDSNDSQQEATIDLKLPRRSLLVTFTCDACGTRSERLINRLAYERGLVYVQCSGCSRYHKLVDNLGLVTEYNLREDIELDAGLNDV